jgi:hypothetical protein
MHIAQTDWPDIQRLARAFPAFPWILAYTTGRSAVGNCKDCLGVECTGVSYNRECHLVTPNKFLRPHVGLQPIESS